MAIIAVLLTLAVPRYFGSLDKSKEAVLREDLYQLRDAIGKYYGDKGKYPESLERSRSKNTCGRCPSTPSRRARRPGWWSRPMIRRRAAYTT